MGQAGLQQVAEERAAAVEEMAGAGDRQGRDRFCLAFDHRLASFRSHPSGLTLQAPPGDDRGTHQALAVLPGAAAGGFVGLGGTDQGLVEPAAGDPDHLDGEHRETHGDRGAVAGYQFRVDFGGQLGGRRRGLAPCPAAEGGLVESAELGAGVLSAWLDALVLCDRTAIRPLVRGLDSIAQVEDGGQDVAAGAGRPAGTGGGCRTGLAEGDGEALDLDPDLFVLDLDRPDRSALEVFPRPPQQAFRRQGGERPIVKRPETGEEPGAHSLIADDSPFEDPVLGPRPESRTRGNKRSGERVISPGVSKMSKSGQVPGCLKYGCVGCLSAMALSVGAVFLITAIHLTSDPEDPQPEQRQVERPLPATPERSPATDGPQIGEVLPLPELEEFPQGADQAAGRVLLDLKMGDFVIRPGPAGEPIRIDADYDAGSFELTEELTTEDDGGWTYAVSFGSKRGLLGLLLGGGRHDIDNRIEITIPRGHPIDLAGEVSMGEFEADLGGLWVRRIDFELGMGEHFIEFSDPLPYPMESFRTESSMGSVEVRSLGDASPSSVTVDHSMGEIFLDLKGAWQGDAEVDVDFTMGECRVWLPEDVRIDVEQASVGLGESSLDRPSVEPPADAPTLTLRVSGSMGEADIEY